MKRILVLSETTKFSILDDITENPYKAKVVYPIDLKTIIARVENGYYRSHLAVKYDIKFLESNIRKLVKSVKRNPSLRFDSEDARNLKHNAKFVTALCLRFIDSHDCINPLDLYESNEEYIETHEVKCYSAKRVHLNLVRKADIANTAKRLHFEPNDLRSYKRKNTQTISHSNTRSSDKEVITLSGNQSFNQVSHELN